MASSSNILLRKHSHLSVSDKRFHNASMAWPALNPLGVSSANVVSIAFFANPHKHFCCKLKHFCFGPNLGRLLGKRVNYGLSWIDALNPANESRGRVFHIRWPMRAFCWEMQAIAGWVLSSKLPKCVIISQLPVACAMTFQGVCDLAQAHPAIPTLVYLFGSHPRTTGGSAIIAPHDTKRLWQRTNFEILVLIWPRATTQCTHFTHRPSLQHATMRSLQHLFHQNNSWCNAAIKLATCIPLFCRGRPLANKVWLGWPHPEMKDEQIVICTELTC